MNLDEQIAFIEVSRQTCADFGTTLGERNYAGILASLRELKRLQEIEQNRAALREILEELPDGQ